MLKSTNGRALVALLVVALIVIAAAVAISKTGDQVAQAPPMPPGAGGYGGQPAGPPPGGPGPGGMGGMMSGGMRPGMMGGGMSMPAITAAGEYIYVVQGNTIYQYNAKTLKFVNKAPLPIATPTPSGGNGQPPMPPQGNG